MSSRIQATFVSVWDDGIEIETPAMFDCETGILDEVQMAELPESLVESLEVLMARVERCSRHFKHTYHGKHREDQDMPQIFHLQS